MVLNCGIFFRRCFDTALITSLTIVSFFIIARTGFAPRNPADGVAVVFAPWTGAKETLTRATDPGGRFVRYGGFSFIAVVVPDEADYPRRMLAAGALLVLDPQALAACLRGFNPKTSLQ